MGFLLLTDAKFEKKGGMCKKKTQKMKKCIINSWFMFKKNK